MQEFKFGLLPIKHWLAFEDIDDECLNQAIHLSNLPFAFHHIALMPDCHSGYGMPIGGVLATEGAIVPNAVGVDIGCGMIAVRTDLHDINQEAITEIIAVARTTIPVGYEHHATRQVVSAEDAILFASAEKHDSPVIRMEMDRAQYQVGTLGSGNHFIELQKGSDGRIWLMVHSGSRNVGKRVCDYYNQRALALNSKWGSVYVPREWDLAFLRIEDDIGNEYIAAMQWCMSFARLNRKLMMQRLLNIFNKVTGGIGEFEIQTHHNYAAKEEHFGKKVWVHRKGAIRMRAEEQGIIPGSMGTPSYIVEGLGNLDSFCSASHGAGRRMSRAAANKTITEQEAQAAMQGIVHDRFHGKYEEAPQAYKNIEDVMSWQKDLVKPIVKLQPLGVMKG
ncbi:MAG: RtcB family protein [Negativicutes bacterium]|nr:RtcB family protein [Negativicutes bacterium]